MISNINGYEATIDKIVKVSCSLVNLRPSDFEVESTNTSQAFVC